MNGIKSWILSKGIWGAIIAGAATIATILNLIFGANVSGGDITTLLTQTQAIVVGIIGLVGSIMALYGRLKATKTIG